MGTITLEGMFKEGIQIGIKNALAVIVNVILWALTIWIPYFNVGTTIGLQTLVAKMGRDEGLKYTEIFSPEYRKYMGEFFLVMGFMMMGYFFGLMLFFIPGLVILLAWSLAPLLVLDKNMEPTSAIKKSNDITYGHKWMMFLGPLLVWVVLVIVMAIISYIGSLIHPVVGGFLSLICIILFIPIVMGIQAYIYRELSKNI